MDDMEIRITNVIENTRCAPIVRDWVRTLLKTRDEVKRLEGENAQLNDDAAQAIQYAVDVKAQMREVRLDLDGWRTSTLALERANVSLVERIDELTQDEEEQHGG